MRLPYWVYGAQQDNSNLAVASFDDEGVIGAATGTRPAAARAASSCPIRAIRRSSTATRKTSSAATTSHVEQVRDISPEASTTPATRLAS